MTRNRTRSIALLGGVLLLGAPGGLVGQDDPKDPKKLPPSQRGENPEVFQPLTPEQEEALKEQRKRYTIPPVSTEPEVPSPDRAKGQGFLALPGHGYLIQDGDRKAKRVVVPGDIGITQGMIEVFATLGPKDHESVLRVRCDVHVFDLAVSSLIGAKRGTLPEKYGEPDPSDESRILIFVSWTDENGRQLTYRAEDLLIDVKRGRLFPRVGWLYQGGWEDTEHPVTGARQRMLRAALSKLLITTFRDPYALVDNTLKDEDATDDIYAANMFLLPQQQTPVLVSVRLPTPEELQEIKRIEREFYP